VNNVQLEVRQEIRDATSLLGHGPLSPWGAIKPLQLAIPPQGDRIESRGRLGGGLAAERQIVRRTPMRRKYLFLIWFLAAGCDSVFTAEGIVADGMGRPIQGARISIRDRTVESDSAGCFHSFLITSPRAHTMLVTVRATGFSSSTGELPSPGALRLRITPSQAKSKFADTVVVNPPAGSLGPCEPRSAAR